MMWASTWTTLYSSLPKLAKHFNGRHNHLRVHLSDDIDHHSLYIILSVVTCMVPERYHVSYDIN